MQRCNYAKSFRRSNSKCNNLCWWWLLNNHSWKQHLPINEDGSSENIFVDEDNTEKSSNNESKILQKALSELEHDYKIIIILREIQELSYDVISKILQLPLGTVKSRINRGKLKLREILINYGVKNYKWLIIDT